MVLVNTSDVFRYMFSDADVDALDKILSGSNHPFHGWGVRNRAGSFVRRAIGGG
jgi:hypothetical protein